MKRLTAAEKRNLQGACKQMFPHEARFWLRMYLELPK